MDREQSAAAGTHGARSAVEPAFAAYWAAERLSSQSLAWLHGSTLPTLVLWTNAWLALPQLVTWLAVLTWAGSAALALSLAIASLKWRVRLAASLLVARSVVRIHFAPVDRSPAVSSLLFLAAVAISSIFWIHGLRPGLLRPEVVDLGVKGWPVFMVGALAHRWLE